MAKAFGARSTADEVLEGFDLTGKRYLVTGISSGLGVETARSLAAHGAEVVGTVRDIAKGRKALVEGGAEGLPIEIIELDLSSLAKVRACADALLADGRPFDGIITNAGMITDKREETADGFEMQFGSNHLGHFVLVNRLVPLLRPGARAVIVASSSHYVSDVDMDDLTFAKPPYDPMVAYARSKTANILFATEFDRRHRDKGIRGAALHPGGIKTGFQRHMRPGEFDEVVRVMNEELEAEGSPLFEFKTIPQGAATSVWVAVTADADAVGGRYSEDCHVSEISTGVINAVLGGVRGYALDAERARQLWSKCEEMVGERY